MQYKMLFNVIVNSLIILIPLLLCVAYTIYMERKIIGFMQYRLGPSVVGPAGLLQPFADAIKLLTKEFIFPARANSILFAIAPIITFTLALAGWAVIPFGSIIKTDNEQVIVVGKAIADLNISVTYILAISAMGVYGIILSGWSSNSKYPFIGCMRSAAQMISYELVATTCIATIIIASGSLNIAEIVERVHVSPLWLKLMLCPVSVVFFISILAETNRHPFDLPEAESELVAGYNVEYSSMPFALFFLGEYANMILMSTVMVMLFMGGWYSPIPLIPVLSEPSVLWIFFKVFLILFSFVWVRAALPRYRYDQLMNLCWKYLLPFSLIWMIIIAFLTVYVRHYSY